MDVRGSVGMPSEPLEELSHRTIVGDRVEARLYRPEPIAPITVGREDASQVVVGLNALLLDVVESLIVGLPDIQLGANHGIQRARAHDGRC